MMNTLIMAAQLILSLSILVVLHELGHFIPAKLFKTKVERFFLFFDPGFRLFSKKIGETVYGIGWLPLGGYVKIAGMIDESMDKEQMKKPAEPWEFRSKPAWQRLIIMLGGIFVNVILAIVIFSGIFLFNGETYLKNEDVKYGIWVNEVGEEIGLKNGDKIISVDGQTVEQFSGWAEKILLGESILIEREGAQLELPITNQHKKSIIKAKSGVMMERLPSIISGVAKGSGAEVAGVEAGDKIVNIEGRSIQFFDELQASVKAFEGETANVQVERDGKVLPLEVEVKTIELAAKEPNAIKKFIRNALGKPIEIAEPTKKKVIGVAPSSPLGLSEHFTVTKKEYNVFTSIPRGAKETWKMLKSQIDSFKLIFQKDTGASKEVGSFFSIGQMFGSSWNWLRFWTLTGILSIWLAFINLLPIPGLDGGHALFTVVEMVTGKAPGEKFMEVMQSIGMIFLLSLMALVIGWDFLKTFFY